MSGIYKVYKYTFPSGMAYIGVTKNSVSERNNQGYQHNKPLQSAIREVGFKCVKVDILADGLEQDEAFDLEKYFISEYGTNDAGRGYNISKGGKSTFEGLHHTEEHKRYMSERLRGIKFSTEHIDKLKESRVKERKPVESTDERGIKTIYISLCEAANAVNGHKANISRACTSERKYKDKYWSFAKGVNA